MKTKQLKSTVSLVVILVILAGAIWWLMSTQDTAVAKKTAFKMSEKEINGLTLERVGPDGKPTKVVLKSTEAKKWEIVDPIKDPAYVTSVENLLKAMAKIEAEVVYKDSKEAGDLANFGLAPASLAVQADFKGKKGSKKILIGSQTPVGYKYFAKFEDDPRILMVESTVKTSLDLDLNAFREKQLTATPKEQIQKVKFWSGADGVWYQLERQKDSAWRLTQPYQDHASGNFDTVVASLAGMLINEYLEETPDLVQYGLNQPSHQVELTLGNGQTVSIKGAQKDEKWYLTNTQRPGIFQFNNISAMDFLNLGIKDLTGTKLSNYGEKEIQSIMTQVGSAPELKLKGKDLTEIRKQLLLGEVVQPYLRASKPVTRAEYDSQPPVSRMSLTIKGKAGAPVELKFYINPDSKELTTYLVTDSERPFVYEVRDTENEKTLLDKIKNVK